ncbi:glycosyl transferase [Vibrio nigripulchritudo]|nr:glycosyltransferase family 9 protein [Vibrio nigripulchritudo]KJY79086.1 glycosyl transferase [Vibrio nigripulchritudo]
MKNKLVPESICIVRLSALGDVCNAISAVQAIQKHYPSARITWVCGAVEAHLIRLIPNVEVIPFDKNNGIRGYFDIWNKLKDRRFDVLLHMQYALRASFVALGIKAKRKIGFDEDRSKDLQHLFINERIKSSDKKHVLDGMMGFAEAVGVEDITPTWDIQISESDKNWATGQLPESGSNLVIAPATSKAYKNWTTKGYQDLINHALNLGWKVTLIGSPDKTEIALAQDIVNHFEGTQINNLVGETTISQMIAIIDQANLLVAPDSGPTHIANAMQTPVIGLYAHHNPERTGPYLQLDNVVSVYDEAILEETGKTSDELPWRSRVKDPNAMKRITSDMVINQFETVVSRLLLNKKESL